jgi:hypothetical protein
MAGKGDALPRFLKLIEKAVTTGSTGKVKATDRALHQVKRLQKGLPNVHTLERSTNMNLAGEQGAAAIAQQVAEAKKARIAALRAQMAILDAQDGATVARKLAREAKGKTPLPPGVRLEDSKKRMLDETTGKLIRVPKRTPPKLSYNRDNGLVTHEGKSDNVAHLTMEAGSKGKRTSPYRVEILKPREFKQGARGLERQISWFKTEADALRYIQGNT